MFSSAIGVCLLILLVKNVECLKSSGRYVSCWPWRMTYDKFPVDVYFSSRTKKDVRHKIYSELDKNLDFDPNRRTAVIIHGFIGTAFDEHINNTRDALLSWQDMNILAVDWREGCTNALLYAQAAVNTEWAAKAISDLIFELTKIVDTPTKNWKPVHIISYSLGVHVAGQTSARLKKERNLLIDRVTGLEPAHPCFSDVESPLRLRKTDARFVDVIHTFGSRKSNIFSTAIIDPLGHADFYVNGGHLQPGCNVELYQAMRNIDERMKKKQNSLFKYFQNFFGIAEALLTLAPSMMICHHDRSFKVFIESIVQNTQSISNKCNFWGHPWTLGTNKSETSRILREKCNKNNCIEMGINAELYDHRDGTYYVKTNYAAPYCAN